MVREFIMVLILSFSCLGISTIYCFLTGKISLEMLSLVIRPATILLMFSGGAILLRRFLYYRKITKKRNS